MKLLEKVRRYSEQMLLLFSFKPGAKHSNCVDNVKDEFALKECPAYVPVGTREREKGTDNQNALYETVETQ